MNSLLVLWEADCPIQSTSAKSRGNKKQRWNFCYAPLAVHHDLGMVLQLPSLKEEQCLVGLTWVSPLWQETGLLRGSLPISGQENMCKYKDLGDLMICISFQLFILCRRFLLFTEQKSEPQQNNCTDTITLSQTDVELGLYSTLLLSFLWHFPRHWSEG